jgi:hypothetical protein
MKASLAASKQKADDSPADHSAAIAKGLEEASMTLQRITPGASTASAKGPASDSTPYLSCMTLASVALHLGTALRSQRPTADVSSSDQLKSIVKQCMSLAQAFSKDSDVSVRAAAGRAAVRIIAMSSSSNKETTMACLNIIVALLGPDQSSGVQQQTLIALKWLIETLDSELEDEREAAGADSGDEERGAMDEHWPVFLPSLCSLMLNVSSGPTKSACERTLRRALRLDQGFEGAQKCLENRPGPTVKAALSESAIRRLHSLNEEEDGLYALSEDY